MSEIDIQLQSTIRSKHMNRYLLSQVRIFFPFFRQTPFHNSFHSFSKVTFNSFNFVSVNAFILYTFNIRQNK